jgi:uncharacterized membrane protein
MNTAFILGGLFFFVIIAFIAGMFSLPELFGISKRDETNQSREKDDEQP